MFQEHYPPLVVAYLVALGGWFLVSLLRPKIWPGGPADDIPKPWREFGFASLGTIGILVMGQLWTRGIRLPEQGLLGDGGLTSARNRQRRVPNFEGYGRNVRAVAAEALFAGGSHSA